MNKSDTSNNKIKNSIFIIFLGFIILTMIFTRSFSGLYLLEYRLGELLVLIGFTAFIIGGISKTLKRSSSEVQTRLGRISSILEETLGGLRIIKGFNAQEYQSEKLEKDKTNERDLRLKLEEEYM